MTRIPPDSADFAAEHPSAEVLLKWLESGLESSSPTAAPTPDSRAIEAHLCSPCRRCRDRCRGLACLTPAAAADRLEALEEHLARQSIASIEDLRERALGEDRRFDALATVLDQALELPARDNHEGRVDLLLAKLYRDLAGCAHAAADRVEAHAPAPANRATHYRACARRLERMALRGRARRDRVDTLQTPQ